MSLENLSSPEYRSSNGLRDPRNLVAAAISGSVVLSAVIILNADRVVSANSDANGTVTPVRHRKNAQCVESLSRQPNGEQACVVWRRVLDDGTCKTLFIDFSKQGSNDTDGCVYERAQVDQNTCKCK